MSGIEIQHWIARGQEILSQTRSIVETAPSDEVRTLLERLPASVSPDDGPVRIVFAGQYSAGKSSIIKALTGRKDIAVGADITTQKTRDYDWNGVVIVDTPGVHTSLRPDHDDVAYQAISEADLLAFVVTNELFDSYLAAHFRKLAIDRDKAYEMFLVVNKMRRCAAGNTPSAQDVIRDDLKRVLVPFTPEQVRTTFIDAEAALQSESEEDEEISRILMNKSGFSSFLEALNNFVREKGLAGRYTTTLYVIEQVLQEALAAESSDDTDVQGLMELYLQQRRALVETQARIPRSVDGLVQETVSSIRRDGRELAELFHGNADRENIERRFHDAQAQMQTRADGLAKQVQDSIEQHMASLGQRFQQIAEGELARELLPRLIARTEVELSDLNTDPKTVATARKASAVTRQLGQFLVQNSFNPATKTFTELFKLNQYSGTATHRTVKAAGHFFGKSFKPWEAVKWTRALANAGRVLAVSGAVVNVILQFKEDADRAKLEADLRETRFAVREGFSEAAQAIEMHFDQTTRTYVMETVDRQLAEVDQKLDDLRKIHHSRGRLFQELGQLLDETRELINESHLQLARRTIPDG